MRVIGIIAEFNPFHNGHEYLIKKARELVDDKRAVVMVVMSGSFTQRGLPSIMPKHVRAKSALLNGADVVLELPFTFAMSPSERFASGAVELLYRTGVVTDIAFGVDCKNADALKALSEINFEDDDTYKAVLKDSLSSGKSFPSARADAIEAVVKNIPDLITDDLKDMLRQPNSILALDYLKAIKANNIRWNVHMIERQGSSYQSTEESDFMSATGIREIINNNRSSVAKETLALAGKMPDKALAIPLAGWLNGEYKIPDMDEYATDIINMVSSSDITGAAYMTDGLDGFIRNSIADMRSGEYNFEGLAKALQTKHFTMPRIYRALSSAMLNQSNTYIEENKHVQFIRVLGFNKEGRYCLKIMSKCSRLPIIHNCSDALHYYSDKPQLKEQFELNKAADNLAAKYLGLPFNYDLSTPPIITK